MLKMVAVLLLLLLSLPLSANATDGEGAKKNVVYFEDFEDFEDTASKGDALQALGWSELSNDDGTARKNCTATLSIENGRLQINNTEESGSNESFLLVTGGEQTADIYEDSFTLQYDVELSESADSARYIAIATHYEKSPSATYSVFHLRSGGYGESRIRTGRIWHNYDTEGEDFAPDTTDGDGTHSLLFKLYGKEYDGTPALVGKSITVRVVYDKEEAGPRVYLKDKESDGEFVLVSAPSKESEGAKSLESGLLVGRDVVLTASASVVGFVDNIILYRGVGEPVFEDYAPPASDEDSATTTANSFVALRDAISSLASGKRAGAVILLGTIAFAISATAYRVRHTEKNEKKKKK
jgi:hypothetical protein